MNLQRRLAHWVEQRAITAAQAEAILKLEEKSGAGQGSLALLLLAAFLIGVGVISLVAANWHEIPNSLKLGLDYLIFASLAIALVRGQGKDARGFDALLFVYAIFALATIGLNSQVFHLSGKWYEAGIFWSAILLMAAAFARSIPLPLIVLGTFFVSLHALVAQEFGNRIAMFSHMGAFRAAGFPVFLLLSCVALLLRRGLGDAAITRAARLLVFTGGVGAVFLSEALRSGEARDATVMPLYVAGGALSLFLAAGIALTPAYRPLQKQILLASLFGFLFAFLLPLVTEVPKVLQAAITVATLFSAALFLLSVGSARGFNLLLVLVGCRFFGLYIAAFGGLARTGVGLIITGLLLVAAIELWRRKLPGLRGWAEEQLL